ncbi:MAG: UDP-N-acetylglucosamine 2-epimerase (non-hydrolyzing) [Candidatus Cloacimonadota bacterium]|nr:MAG: UDP-N-acetylglucosamine 2-epimerase (non-hydrolyzing) [Candidatus Cloacimonadota bacterium]
MKIVTVIGARPQFVKAAAVSRAIIKNNEINGNIKIKEIIIHTGQHFDENMSKIFFGQMKIPKPHYNLNINSIGHGAMTGRMLEQTEEILVKEKPDYVLVYGDTNSTLAGALAAKKLHIKVIHVESGLRSFNMKMPEEINRILTDRISDILFCPTDSAVQNLKNEGYEKLNCKIIKNGDVMLDAAVFYSNSAKKPQNKLPSDFILATIHRPSNTDDLFNLKKIFTSFEEISKYRTIVIPLHPRTRNILQKNNIILKNILTIEPAGYLEMIWLIKNCRFVMTDSGGLQKEAFFFKKYCLTLRDQTEWTELILNGVNRLVNVKSDDIVKIAQNIPDFPETNLELYGNGSASDIIVRELLKN